GKIAVVWEGTCPVATKAAFAQQAGALAVLIAGKSDAQHPPISRFQLGLENELPAVQIPVLYLSPSDFQTVDVAFQSGTEVMACLNRPAVFLNSVSYPPDEIQQYCFSPIEPFRFSARLRNLSGIDLQNITLQGVLERENGQILLSSTLIIPELEASVTDSLYLLPDVFDQVNMTNGIHQVVYTVQGTANGIPYLDTRKVRFNVNSDVLAKELTGSQVAYRPDTIPESGWTVANVFHLSGTWLDHFVALGTDISVIRGEEILDLEEISLEISLFSINEDVLPDFSNFEPDGSSMVLIGVGYATENLSEKESLVWVEIIDLGTAEAGVVLEHNRNYLLAATFEGPNKYLYQGFSEDHKDGKISTIVKTDQQWHPVNLYGKPNAVLRLYLDGGYICPTINTTEPAPINFNISPNPVHDYVTLQAAFETSTDALITFYDINGRVIVSDVRKGLTDDKLMYPVAQFPNGANLVRITTPKGTETKVFLVQKE
ncbi:MAG: T9SS type A sorting domain-containing protein, partial [Saprospiraceae bacterium]|nr:T9SS type A sorting domain-containing protein [Saprospiraceae bacterium]